MRELFDEINRTIEENQTFLIASHINPDGDAIGSSMALSSYLKEQRHKEVSVLLSEYPQRFDFLIDQEIINDNTPAEEPDVLIILDSSSPDRMVFNKTIKLFTEAKVINIDHHPRNFFFGAINWVDKNAAAVGYMVYKLLKYLQADFTKHISEALYTAILTDSARFTSPKINSDVLAACATLAANGLDLRILAQNIYLSYDISYLKNLSIALNNLETFLDNRILFLSLDQDSMNSYNTTLDQTDGIVDLALIVKSAKIGVLFKEVSEHEIRVSFRARHDLNIISIVSEFGGGGHHNAAGCTIHKPLHETKNIILDRCKALFYEQD